MSLWELSEAKVRVINKVLVLFRISSAAVGVGTKISKVSSYLNTFSKLYLKYLLCKCTDVKGFQGLFAALSVSALARFRRDLLKSCDISTKSKSPCYDCLIWPWFLPADGPVPCVRGPGSGPHALRGRLLLLMQGNQGNKGGGNGLQFLSTQRVVWPTIISQAVFK